MQEGQTPNPVFVFRVSRKARLRQYMRRFRWSSLITLITLMSGCNLQLPSNIVHPPPQEPTQTPTSTATQPNTLIPTMPSTQGSTTQPTTWQTIDVGIEQRFLIPGTPHPFVQFVVFRIDPAYFNFRVHYQRPLTGTEWREALPNAALFINGNFFDTSGNALGLIVSDGTVYGQSYNGFGGFLQVQNGIVRVRSNIFEPYANEPLEQAVQAFPMLVTNSQASYFNTQGDRASRRTIVAQDTQGRILLIVSNSLFGLSLVEMSQYLVESQLDIVNALNLDGGGSTLLSVRTNSIDYFVPSFDAVPVVLALYRR